MHHLSEDGGKLGVVEVRYGGNAGTVLRKLLQTTLELVKGSQTKQIHLLVGRFLEGVQHVAQSQTQEHVSERERERVCVCVGVGE